VNRNRLLVTSVIGTGAVILFPAALAAAPSFEGVDGWEYLTWGMTVEQVGEALASRGVAAAYGAATKDPGSWYTITRDKWDGAIYFYNGLLSEVNFEILDAWTEKEAQAYYDELVARFGPPAEHGTIAAGDLPRDDEYWIWRNPMTELKYTVGRYYIEGNDRVVAWVEYSSVQYPVK
jgi:hypothetical protein